MTPILILALLSTARGFTPSSSFCGISFTHERSVVALAAQKMTPTRKTRRDDSFDRSSEGGGNVEKDGE